MNGYHLPSFLFKSDVNTSNSQQLASNIVLSGNESDQEKEQDRMRRIRECWSEPWVKFKWVIHPENRNRSEEMARFQEKRLSLWKEDWDVVWNTLKNRISEYNRTVDGLKNKLLETNK